jgi:hypothetical protein
MYINNDVKVLALRHMNNEYSALDWTKPVAWIVIENLANHCHEACFKLYNDL